MFLARPKSSVGPNDHKLLHAHVCDTNEVAKVKGEVFDFRHRRSRAAEKPSKKTGAKNPPFFGLRAAPGGQKALPSEALSPGALGSPHLFLLGVGGGGGVAPIFWKAFPGLGAGQAAKMLLPKKLWPDCLQVLLPRCCRPPLSGA